MARRVKEFIDIAEFDSLDDLIAKLVQIRTDLPETAEAELKLRGDEIFGRRLSIAYFRDQTPEEAAIEARYAFRRPDDRAREIGASEQDVAADAAPGKRRKLGVVA